MSFVTDHNVDDPIVQALLAVKFDVRRIKELTPSTGDWFVLQACLNAKGILITHDIGIPSQAYFYGFAQKGLTVVLLRWKHRTYRDWQQIVEIILRDGYLWEEAASKAPSIITVSYTGGSRVRPWSEIPSVITLQALTQIGHPPQQGHLL